MRGNAHALYHYEDTLAHWASHKRTT